MATTANGWTVVEDSDCDPLIVAGVPIVRGVRRGDIWVVLRWVAQQFHTRVEPLRSPGCWGYNRRLIPGSTTWSEHAAGAAMDLNAPKHNQGDDPTPGPGGGYTAAQVATIHAIERETAGAVVWGGDWSNPDGMHFEASGNHAAVARFADKIRESEMAVELNEDDIAAVANATVSRLGVRLDNQAELASPTDTIVKELRALTERAVAPVRTELSAVRSDLSAVRATLASLPAATIDTEAVIAALTPALAGIVEDAVRAVLREGVETD